MEVLKIPLTESTPEPAVEATTLKESFQKKQSVSGIEVFIDSAITQTDLDLVNEFLTYLNDPGAVETDVNRLSRLLPPNYTHPDLSRTPRLTIVSPDYYNDLNLSGCTYGGLLADSLVLVASKDLRATFIHELTHALQPFSFQFNPDVRPFLEGITTAVEYEIVEGNIHKTFLHYLAEIEDQSSHLLAQMMEEGQLKQTFDIPGLYYSLASPSKDEVYRYANKVNEYLFIGSFLTWYKEIKQPPWDIFTPDPSVFMGYSGIKRRLPYFLSERENSHPTPSQLTIFFGSPLCRLVIPPTDPLLEELENNLSDLRTDQQTEKEQGKQYIIEFVNTAVLRLDQLGREYAEFLTTPPLE